ncbi:hypothetical protein BZA05DRAFT_392551 [Tricharina praecox]|uniref:uncharacterized protein n=1 Tax=Tricharina praecox TaxID=43433 RepID=UPI00221FF87A|nr:uncharacterized protein BZA05DRAFT_392551 [Tricharina praecox]KAI5854783.1 hypothetical protein BZA05DRAFT_392551 [Tricharina praecox]
MVRESLTAAAGRVALLLLVAGGKVVSAHDHDGSDVPEGEVVSPEPLDSILWWHICTMIVAFGILFPIGMVLGIVRSRWHVPVQVVATVVATTGWFLGHAHKGRQFSHNIHATFAPVLMMMLVTQIGLGIYLKLHLERGIHGRIRRVAVVLHGIVGKAMPVMSWIQMLFGGITALGFCRADHLGQCLAHFIMGSSFIAYGIILTMMLLVGQGWLRRSGRSQEFWDSLVISIWGCINTFTEHRWGTGWNHSDIQHTSMGVVWWCAGLLGLWLSRSKDGQPRRNVIPAIVIFLTGWAMSGHAQHLPLSTMVHAVFGYTLMAAGASRVIEICFVLQDKPTRDEPSSFQHLTPFLLFASGFIFMSATEEQLALIDSVGIDHVSYLLVLYSLAFLLYLLVQVLLHIFVANAPEAKPAYNPISLENGHSREAEEQRARETDEFELAGLITDDEDADSDSDGPRKP